MDYLELYYSNNVGKHPDSEMDRVKSQNIINYLIEAGVSQENILDFVENAPASQCLDVTMLPEKLWDNSLLKPDTFYYHHLLQLTSPPPQFNSMTRKETVYPYYLEMKIQFSMNELIQYAYRQLGLDYALADRKRDENALNYLLNLYDKKFEFEAIDFVLALIDTAKIEEDREFSNILEIRSYEQEVLKNFRTKIAEANLSNVNQIVWR